MKIFFFHFLQNNSSSSMHKNDFNLYSLKFFTNVRNIVNDSFGSCTELVQNAYDASSTQRTVQSATNGTVAQEPACK